MDELGELRFKDSRTPIGLANIMADEHWKAKGEPKVVVFWGAGCSKTAGIPSLAES